MNEFVDLISKFKYLVLGGDTSCNVYKSLRDISNDIIVDYTTISKKLKDNQGEWCLCTSKQNKLNYYIKKIKIDI